MDKQEYEANVKTLRKWARDYYYLDEPTATDDEMENEIENFDSPTHFVGWKDE